MDFSRGQCLLVADRPELATFFVKILNQAFKDLEVVVKRSMRESSEWMLERSSINDPGILDLAIIDLSISDGTGIELLRTLASKESGPSIIAIAIHADDLLLFEALGCGSFGYLIKTCDEGTLIALLKRLNHAEPPLSATVAQKLGLSPLTVAGYVKIIYQKLHVSNRAEATREAIRRGLV